MPRGGRRNGIPGQAYGNRSDLNAGAKPIPMQAVPGQQYGAVKQQIDAQRAVPMQGTPMPPTSPQQPTPGQPGTPDPLLAQASPVTYPGDHGDPTRPTQRPSEPVTAGLAVGPGPGPEMLPTSPASAQTVGQFLQSLASRPGAPSDIVALASLAQSRG